MAVPVHLFYGSDDYTSLTTLQQWQRQFIKRHNDASISHLEGESSDIIDDIKNSTSSQTLFAETRLVIIKNINIIKDQATEEALLNLIKSATEGQLVVLAWWRGEFDQRRKLWKEIVKLNKADQLQLHQYQEPQAAQRAQWLRQLGQKMGVNISDDALNYLLFCSSNQSLWYLVTDLKLLATVSDQIDLTLAQRYVKPVVELAPFVLTDQLLAGKKREALTQFADLALRRGNNQAELAPLFGTLVWLIRTVLLLTYWQEQGISNPSELAQRAEVNPYVVRRTMPYLARFDSAKMKQLLLQAAKLDQQVKSGNFELVWACEELILSI